GSHEGYVTVEDEEPASLAPECPLGGQHGVGGAELLRLRAELDDDAPGACVSGARIRGALDRLADLPGLNSEHGDESADRNGQCGLDDVSDGGAASDRMEELDDARAHPLPLTGGENQRGRARASRGLHGCARARISRARSAGSWRTRLVPDIRSPPTHP